MLLSISLKSMVLLCAMGTGVKAMCPYMAKGGQVADVKMTENAHAEEGRRLMQRSLAVNTRTNDAGIPEGGFKAVRDDLRALMTDSQDFFPADFDPPVGPHYGGEC
jgi:catalase (peroxidase I)